MQRAIQTCIMRGGTSKAIFLAASELPPPGKLRDQVILRLFGSPDPRQIDGLGGADTLTSKLAIIGPPSEPGADVDYTFGQVSFKESKVDYGGNCGNISSAVGPYAIDKGLLEVAAGEKERVVRVYNTNTKALLKCTVQLAEGKSMVDGDVEIAGVPGCAAAVDLDFSATSGSVTGKLLPTGNLRDVLQLGGEDTVEVTLLDAGQPMVFLRASDLFEAGGSVKEQAEVLKKSPEMLARVERIRGAAAVEMGIVKRWQDAEKESPYTPFVAAISPAEDADFGSLCVFMQQLHQAYPVTGSVATVAAALIEGSIINEAAPHLAGRPSSLVRIGHPSGVMEVDAAVGDGPQLLRAAMRRSARCLMDGQAYIPWSVWPAD